MRTSGVVVLSLVMFVSLVVAACGGGTEAPTATPPRLTTPATVAPRPTPPGPTATVAAPIPILIGTVAPTAIAPRPTVTPPSPTLVAAAAPKYGGILTIHAFTEHAQLNIYARRLPETTMVMNNVLNHVVRVDPYTKQFGPDLAERWEVGDGGRTYTFFLNRNARWHDGRPVVAGDIVYTVNKLVMNSFNRSKFTAVGFDKVEAIDQSTIRFTLQQPSASFLQALGLVFILIYPEHIDASDFTKNPVGSGPFKFKTKDPSSFQMEKNPSYFVKGLPYLDGIIQYTVPDANAARAAFRTKRLLLTSTPLAGTLNRSFVESLAKEIPGMGQTTFFNGLWEMRLNQIKPFTDQRVRTAIHLGIDRRELFRTYWQGGPGTDLASINVPAEYGGKWALPKEEMAQMPGFRQPKDQDIARAKALLREAGFPEGTLSMTLLTRPQVTGDMPVITAALLEKIGIKAKVDGVDLGTYQERLDRGSFEATAAGILTEADDPFTSIAPLYVTGGSLNYGGWSNPEIDALYAKQASILDPAQRKSIINELERKAIEWAIDITVFWTLSFQLWWPEIKNVPETPSLYDDRYRYDQVWLEK